MKNNKKIFVVGGSLEYANWLLPLGFELTFKLSKADLVFFTGGEDVAPSFYNRRQHPTIYCNIQRDIMEEQIFNQCLSNKVKMIGTCRGLQFLTAASGGIMVQHQENPSFLHYINTFDGEKIIQSSTHHNAAYPWHMPKDEFRVLGWSTGISRFHEDWDSSEMVNGVVEDNKECEIVYYPKTNAIGWQGHNEMIFDPRGSRMKDDIVKAIEYSQNLFMKFFNDEL